MIAAQRRSRRGVPIILCGWTWRRFRDLGSYETAGPDYDVPLELLEEFMASLGGHAERLLT
jgi:hypothetical protein